MNQCMYKKDTKMKQSDKERQFWKSINYVRSNGEKPKYWKNKQFKSAPTIFAFWVQ